MDGARPTDRVRGRGSGLWSRRRQQLDRGAVETGGSASIQPWSTVYVGDTEAIAVYVGDVLVWGVPSEPAGRNPLFQPFATNSIWNMPIGTSATYVDAQLSGEPDGDDTALMPQAEHEVIILDPDAPLRNLSVSDGGWGGDRCSVTGSTLEQVPIPDGFIVESSGRNSGAAILKGDGRTLRNVIAFARCASAGPATYFDGTVNAADLYGDGILGTHGASNLSILGGTIRLGELRPGQQGPRHALKINVWAAGHLGNVSAWEDGFVWPATGADGYAVDSYGTEGSPPSQMKMGALLALPASVDLGTLGLETEPGEQLAWTFQNYGAYIVDDTWDPHFAIAVEEGSAGSFQDQFETDWGYSFEARVYENTAWMRDVQRIVEGLHVVTNNSPSSIGGGGTPLQPLAPELIEP